MVEINLVPYLVAFVVGKMDQICYPSKCTKHPFLVFGLHVYMMVSYLREGPFTMKFEKGEHFESRGLLLMLWLSC